MRLVMLLMYLSTHLVWCIPPPHPAVLAVRREEAQLPFHLRSRALHNPHLQEVLPLASLLHKGEMAVYQREADDVSRQEIYNILTHAGLLKRKPGFYQTPRSPWTLHKRPSISSYSDSSLLHNPELLQLI